MLAVVGFQVGLLVASGAPSVLAFPFGFVNHGGGHDTCGHSDDGVTEYHDHSRQETPHESDRGDVAISNRGEGDNRPIDAGANVGELSAWLSSLDHKHESAKDGDQNEHKKEIDGDFPETHFDALKEQVTFVDEGEEFEHSENADEPEHTQNEKVTRTRQVRYEGEIERKCRHQVDDAKETQRIFLAAGRAVEAQDVFDGEEEGEDILKDGKHVLEPPDHSRFGLNKGDNEAKNDGNHHRYVKDFSGWRVGICHDVIKARLIFQ